MKGVKKNWAVALAALMLLLIVFGADILRPAAVALVEGAERMRLQRLTPGYSIKETEDFIIRFPIEDIGIVHRVETQARAQLALAAEYFGYIPDKKIRLNVYQDSYNLQKGLRLPNRGTTLGAYYAGTINVLSPKAWGEEGDAAEQGLYIHEFTHLIMADMAGGNYPTWFTEGMALHQEYINTGFEWGRECIFHCMPYSLKELSADFANLDQYLAYKQSFLLVNRMLELEGKDRVIELFKGLKKNIPFNNAFYQTFGYLPGDLVQFTEQCLRDKNGGLTEMEP